MNAKAVSVAGAEVRVAGVERGALVVDTCTDGWARPFDGGGYCDCGCRDGCANRCCDGLGGFGVSVSSRRRRNLSQRRGRGMEGKDA